MAVNRQKAVLAYLLTLTFAVLGVAAVGRAPLQTENHATAIVDSAHLTAAPPAKLERAVSVDGLSVKRLVGTAVLVSTSAQIAFASTTVTRESKPQNLPSSTRGCIRYRAPPATRIG